MARIRDLFALLATALLVTAVGVGTFLAADIYHVNPLWVFVVILSAYFFADIGWEYRKEFRRPLFVLFLCVWLLLHSAVFVFVGDSFGLFWYPVAVFIELFLFYATAYWFFGLDPPLIRKRQ